MMKTYRLLVPMFVLALALSGASAYAGWGCGSKSASGESACSTNKSAHVAKGDNTAKTDAAENALPAASCSTEGKSEAKACSSKDAAAKAEGKACCAKDAAKACDKDAKAACCTADKSCGDKCPKAAAALGGAEANKSKADVAPKAYSVGATVEPFSATDAASGETKSVKDLAGSKATVVIFWNQNCPFVVEVQDRVAEFANAHSANGVKVVAIDAGVNNSAEDIKKYATGKPYPILVNSDSKVAAAFGATRTPEVFVLNPDMKIIYHGAFDSGKNKTESGARENYVADVVEALAAGKTYKESTKAFGCTVKYAEGVKPLPRD